MAEFSYDIRIPRDRVAVLIGKNGLTKKSLEQATSTSIKVDSKEGDITVTGSDAIGLYATKEIIKAVGRGFNPEIAMKLLSQDYSFEVINLGDYIKSKNSAYRVKARVIGAEGKARGIIEELTDCNISVYGKTISIIGEIDRVPLARKAIESLLGGSPHANVYRWLEKQRRTLKKEDAFSAYKGPDEDK